MANLHLNLGGNWKVPKAVFIKQGATWTPVSKVWRNNSGTWIKHWPPPINFINDTTPYSITGSKVTADDGWSAVGTLLIPASHRSTTITHLTSLTMQMVSTRGDDDYHDDDNGIDGSNSLQFSGVYHTVDNYGDITMGALTYSSYYSVGAANQAGVRLGTLNVPSDHLLIGIEYQVYSYKNKQAQSAFKFRLITAPVSTGVLSKSGTGVYQTVSKNTGSDINGTLTGTLSCPLGSSIYSVGMGYGFYITKETSGDSAYDDADNGSHTNIQLSMYHNPTTTIQ